GSRRRGRAPPWHPCRTPLPPLRHEPREERGTRPTRPSLWSSRRLQSLFSALAATQRAARATLALSPFGTLAHVSDGKDAPAEREWSTPASSRWGEPHPTGDARSTCAAACHGA